LGVKLIHLLHAPSGSTFGPSLILQQGYEQNLVDTCNILDMVVASCARSNLIISSCAIYVIKSNVSDDIP
jgi:hypothetical protein